MQLMSPAVARDVYVDGSIQVWTVHDEAREESLHREAIEGLAREFGQPVDEVAEIYQHETARLKADAKTQEFVALLAARRTRERLTLTAG